MNFRSSRRSAFYDVTKGNDTSIIVVEDSWRPATSSSSSPSNHAEGPTKYRQKQEAASQCFFFSCGCKQRAKLSPALFLQIYRECVVKSIAQGCSAAFQHEHERSSVKGFEVGRSNPQSRKLLHLAKRDDCLILTVYKSSAPFFLSALHRFELLRHNPAPRAQRRHPVQCSYCLRGHLHVTRWRHFRWKWLC